MAASDFGTINASARVVYDVDEEARRMRAIAEAPPTPRTPIARFSVQAMEDPVSRRELRRLRHPGQGVDAGRSDHVLWKKRLTEMLPGRQRIEPGGVAGSPRPPSRALV